MSLQLDANRSDMLQENDLVLVPKTPNWDLKRDVKPKLEELNRQTQAAIADLIRGCCISFSFHCSRANSSLPVFCRRQARPAAG